MTVNSRLPINTDSSRDEDYVGDIDERVTENEIKKFPCYTRCNLIICNHKSIF